MLALRGIQNNMKAKGESMNKKLSILLLALLGAGCSGTGGRFDPETVEKRDSMTAANPVVQELKVPDMDPKRKVSEQDCSKPVDIAAGNLMCRGTTAAEREAERKRLEEEERQRRLAAERRAKAQEDARRAEAEARAAAERAERERLAALAAAEAARKAKAEEDARLAAELKARQERELQERLAAEAAARERAAREAREAAERECQRLEQERNDGRVALENFVAGYGNVGEFKEISGQITAFLNKARKPKPCP